MAAKLATSSPNTTWVPTSSARNTQRKVEEKDVAYVGVVLATAKSPLHLELRMKIRDLEQKVAELENEIEKLRESCAELRDKLPAALVEVRECYGGPWEDFYDSVVAQLRADEPRESFESVKNWLRQQGKLHG